MGELGGEGGGMSNYTIRWVESCPWKVELWWSRVAKGYATETAQPGTVH